MPREGRKHRHAGIQSRASTSHAMAGADPRHRRNAQSGSSAQEVGGSLGFDRKGRMRVDAEAPFDTAEKLKLKVGKNLKVNSSGALEVDPPALKSFQGLQVNLGGELELNTGNSLTVDARTNELRVAPMTAQADSTATTVSALKTDLNALLAKLRKQEFLEQ